MNRHKHICFIHLILFLSSFLLFSVNGLNSKGNENQLISSGKESVSKQNQASSSLVQQLSEEKETESENDLEPVIKILPFLFSDLRNESRDLSCQNSPHKTLRPSLPIYLSVNNFRI